jgi:hypothetical protein
MASGISGVTQNPTAPPRFASTDRDFFFLNNPKNPIVHSPLSVLGFILPDL